MNEQQLQSEFKETLSQHERRIVMLQYWDALSYAEIAAVLDLPTSLVVHTLTNLEQRARSLRDAASLRESG